MTNEQIQLLRRVLGYLQPIELGSVQTVHIAPAQRLRNEADKIEQQEKDYLAFKDLIDKLK